MRTQGTSERRSSRISDMGKRPLVEAYTHTPPPGFFLMLPQRCDLGAHCPVFRTLSSLSFQARLCKERGQGMAGG